MSDWDAKPTLHRYLKRGREAALWKLDGLGEYDVRRPMTRTATNLLGLIKHLACAESVYFGAVFGRPFAEPTAWDDRDTAEENADMWATADETREQITGLYRRVWAHSDATIEALDLDATGRVPWWPDHRNPVTLHQILVHMIAETERHAGHTDILRELIDGSVGIRPESANLPPRDEAWWQDYRDRVEHAAQEAAKR